MSEKPHSEHFYESGRGRELWLEAHRACDADRDSMWEWVADRYFALEEQLEAACFALDGSHARSYREGVREEKARAKEQLEATQTRLGHAEQFIAHMYMSYRYAEWMGDEAPNPAKYPTLDDRNPASVVGVPWNEKGYAGGEPDPASVSERGADPARPAGASRPDPRSETPDPASRQEDA